MCSRVRSLSIACYCMSDAFYHTLNKPKTGVLVGYARHPRSCFWPSTLSNALKTPSNDGISNACPKRLQATSQTLNTSERLWASVFECFRTQSNEPQISGRPRYCLSDDTDLQLHRPRCMFELKRKKTTKASERLRLLPSAHE